MNAKVSASGPTKAGKVLGVVGVVAALLVGASSAFAQSHGGGGGHAGGGGGGGHFGGGGMSHGGAVGHFSGGSRGFAGGGYRGQVGGGRAYSYGRGIGVGVGIHGGGYGGYGYRSWGGGYWRGGYWPSAYYGWSYPLYLGFLPALYSTYWWGGVPYYYVNSVYYTWNAGDNGYVAVDPPPATDGYSADVNAAAAAGPDGGGAADNIPQDVAPAAPGAGVIAYPRNGQTDQQQSTDKFQCHTWAKGQAGFDPTSQASSNASAGARSAYGRAMDACLEARGYTVR